MSFLFQSLKKLRLGYLSVTTSSWELTATPENNTSQTGTGVIVLDSSGNKCWEKTSTPCTPTATSNWDGR